MRGCWLADHGFWEGPDEMPECDGSFYRCHLIKEQVLLRNGVVDPWRECWWVWACGGPMGNGGHHGHFDYSKRLRVPFDQLPDRLLIAAADAGLMWWLELTYSRARYTPPAPYA